LNECEDIRVIKQVLNSFTRRKFKNEVICHVVLYMLYTYF
jgi:hypothetical protein